jgi:hypothetical protein
MAFGGMLAARAGYLLAIVTHWSALSTGSLTSYRTLMIAFGSDFGNCSI